MKSVQIVPVSYSDILTYPKKYNTSNLRFPFLQVNSQSVQVSKWWWSSLENDEREMFTGVDVIQMDVVDESLQCSEFFYLKNIEMFEMQKTRDKLVRKYGFKNFLDLLASYSEMIVIEITSEEKEYLLSLAFILCQRSRKINENDRDSRHYINLEKKIQMSMFERGWLLDGTVKYFMKFGTTSSKHDDPEGKSRPFTTYLQLFEMMVRSKKFVKCEFEKVKKASFLIIKEFKDTMWDEKSEFRAFVNRGNLTLTQQHWNTPLNLDKQELQKLKDAILKIDVSILSVYSICCIDLHWNRKSNVMEVIEYNPPCVSGLGAISYWEFDNLYKPVEASDIIKLYLVTDDQ